MAAGATAVGSSASASIRPVSSRSCGQRSTTGSWAPGSRPSAVRVGWVGDHLRREGTPRPRGRDDPDPGRDRRARGGAGCVSLALLASPFGEPIYERLGFPGRGRLPAHRRLGSRVRPATEADPVELRSFRPDDLPVILAIDAGATGEDRSHVIRASADPTSGVVALGPDGRVVGYELRTPWGTHRSSRRSSSTESGCSRTGERGPRPGPSPDRHPGVEPGRVDDAREPRWHSERSLVRMVRGAPIAWHPSSIWGQFNFALG